MSELEGIGDIVTGGLIAGAVEPAAGGAGDEGHTHEEACLNCGSALTGSYCASCGQKAHVHRSLRAFFSDLIVNLFDFESKIWRTLPMLAFRPGELTSRYVAGERAHFVSPIALYLFSVFAMFAVLNFNGVLDPDIGDTVEGNIKPAIAKQTEVLSELYEERKTAIAEKEDVTSLDRKIAREREDLQKLESIASGKVGLTVDKGDEVPPWARNVVAQAQRDPEKLVYNVQDAASKFSWLLIPISIPFLWLLFPLRRRTHLYDHAVFVTYSLSFMMMLVIGAGLLVAAGWTSLATILFFVPPFHMYRQLKGAYNLGRWSALLRTVALVVFAFVAVGLFAATIFGLGLFS